MSLFYSCNLVFPFLTLSKTQRRKEERKFNEPNPYNQASVHFQEHSADDFSKFPNYGCTGRGTEQGPDGSCICSQGFLFGDPQYSRGCWTCKDPCDDFAECTYPGKCTCLAGFEGDGIECLLQPPILLSLTPDHCSITEMAVINISFQYKKTVQQNSGFCQFGSTIVPGIITDNGIIQCQAPLMNVSTVQVSISYDNFSWSHEYAEFSYEPEEEIHIYPYFMFAAGFISLLINSYCFFKPDETSYSSNETVQEDEGNINEPLISGGQDSNLALRNSNLPANEKK